MRAVNIKLVYRILTGGFLLLGLLLYVSLPAAAPETTVPSAGLIRLHVLANSDSETDQALKRKVRDEIIQAMAPEFLASSDIDSARLTAQANLSRIKAIASRVILEEGKDYQVTAELDTFPFPTKHYGAFILPAGEYEAVRVVIGNGGGTNWWCVLFPPLCFVDMTRNATFATTAISITTNPSTPEVTIDGQSAQTFDDPTAVDIYGKAVSEEDDGKVIFAFRLVELFRRL